MTGPVTFPARRGVKIDRPRMIDFGGQLRPPMGGPVQHIDRLGTRHAIDITIPLMRAEPDGRIWSAALRMAKLYGALVPYRQDGLKVGIPGAPTVNGAGQSGTTLLIHNFTPVYSVRFGQAFSLVHAGRRYLHFAAEDRVVASDGTITLAIFPMLRVIPADGDLCEFGIPMIQGSLSGNELAWTRLAAPYHDFGSITLSEDE